MLTHAKNGQVSVKKKSRLSASIKDPSDGSGTTVVLKNKRRKCWLKTEPTGTFTKIEKTQGREKIGNKTQKSIDDITKTNVNGRNFGELRIKTN